MTGWLIGVKQQPVKLYGSNSKVGSIPTPVFFASVVQLVERFLGMEEGGRKTRREFESHR